MTRTTYRVLPQIKAADKPCFVMEIIDMECVTADSPALQAMTDLSQDLALFEVTSALATVGLSANVTPGLPEPAQLLLVALMFLGRVGPITLASSLSLRTTPRDYRLPEGRPMIG